MNNLRDQNANPNKVKFQLGVILRFVLIISVAINVCYVAYFIYTYFNGVKDLRVATASIVLFLQYQLLNKYEAYVKKRFNYPQIKDERNLSPLNQINNEESLAEEKRELRKEYLLAILIIIGFIVSGWIIVNVFMELINNYSGGYIRLVNTLFLLSVAALLLYGVNSLFKKI